jgi:serine/threonine protein kinase
VLNDRSQSLYYAVHHQGIIHRDIKPANLLWTEDRRQVKIGDFGVSHFSYAQRLAAAGKDGDKDPHDPILLDDSDLTRRAGTPSFLAPEVVYEHTYTSPSSSSPPSGASSIYAVGSSSTVASSLRRPRPPITKAIDIWALGVTLYCLLFGKTPFIADPNLPTSEWSLYNSICNNDWEPEETMGFDRILTGGRTPKDDDSEGSMVIHLLDHFLDKDVLQRITLDEVKVCVFVCCA